MIGDLLPDSAIPIGAQLDELDREIASREVTYPTAVRHGRLAQVTADRRLMTLRATRRLIAAIAEAIPPAFRQ